MGPEILLTSLDQTTNWTKTPWLCQISITTGQALMEKEEQEAQARVQEAGNVCGFYVSLLIYSKCAMEAAWFVWTCLDAISWIFFKVDVPVLHNATRFLWFLFDSSVGMFPKTRTHTSIHTLLTYNKHFLHHRLAVSHRWDVPFMVTTSATTRRAAESFHQTQPQKPPRLVSERQNWQTIGTQNPQDLSKRNQSWNPP